MSTGQLVLSETEANDLRYCLRVLSKASNASSGGSRIELEDGGSILDQIIRDAKIVEYEQVKGGGLTVKRVLRDGYPTSSSSFYEPLKSEKALRRE